jgi:hypothetical protein
MFTKGSNIVLGVFGVLCFVLGLMLDRHAAAARDAALGSRSAEMLQLAHNFMILAQVILWGGVAMMVICIASIVRGRNAKNSKPKT